MSRILKFLLTPSHVFWGTICIFIILFISNGVPFIYSDGFGSYHTAGCILNEGSFACSERPTYFPDYSYHTVSYFEDSYVTVYAPASALFQLPGQFIAQFFESGDPYTDYFEAASGHSYAEGTAFVITSAVLALCSLILMYFSLKNFGISRYVATAATTLTYASSYAIWYVFLLSGFNHNIEILGLSLQLLGFSLLYKEKKGEGILALAVGVGISVMARPTLVVLGIVVGLYLVYKRYFRELALYIGAGAPFAILYLAYNKISYGDFFSSSYNLLFNQTFSFESWNGLQLLFSPMRGWFVYSPLLLFSIVGLLICLKNKKLRLVSVTALIGIATTATLYGFWPTWWSGGSYGQRFMISFIPFLSLGTAFLIKEILVLKKQYLKHILLAFLVLLALFSSITTILYRLTPVADLRPRSENINAMSSGDRYRIWDIYLYHVDLARSSDSVPAYASKLVNSVSGGHSFLSYGLGFSKHVLKIDTRTQNEINLVYVKNPVRDTPPPQNLEILLFDKNTEELSTYTVEINDSVTFTCEKICSIDGIAASSVSEWKSIDNAEYGGFWINQNLQIFIGYNEEMYIKGTPIRVEPGVNYY